MGGQFGLEAGAEAPEAIGVVGSEMGNWPCSWLLTVSMIWRAPLRRRRTGAATWLALSEPPAYTAGARPRHASTSIWPYSSTGMTGVALRPRSGRCMHKR